MRLVLGSRQSIARSARGLIGPHLITRGTKMEDGNSTEDPSNVSPSFLFFFSGPGEATSAPKQRRVCTAKPGRHDDVATMARDNEIT